MTDAKNEFIRKWLAEAYEEPEVSIEFQLQEPFYKDEMTRTGVSITMETLQPTDSQEDDGILNFNPVMETDDTSASKDWQGNMSHTIQPDSGIVKVEGDKATLQNGPTIFAPLPQQQMIRLEECAAVAEKEEEDEDGYDFPVSKVSVAELIESLPKRVRANLPRMLMRSKVLRGNKTWPMK